MKIIDFLFQTLTCIEAFGVLSDYIENRGFEAVSHEFEKDSSLHKRMCYEVHSPVRLERRISTIGYVYVELCHFSGLNFMF
jgi:hypothetical protein